jgi:hypothetical protein
MILGLTIWQKVPVQILDYSNGQGKLTQSTRGGNQLTAEKIGVKTSATEYHADTAHV